ncbi:hypothetical protein PR048_017228 [Dryococelus australis]|uniref:Uncharacterized protein n=1 Tax=Dryococelus australis TaxID=614101 RepID=A0ABQ9H8Y7_9NEOP|nr:hypothetical protein PR048_017228 [Dryococelus australis]
MTNRYLRGSNHHSHPCANTAARYFADDPRGHKPRSPLSCVRFLFAATKPSQDVEMEEHGLKGFMKLRVQAQEVRERYGRQLHARLAPLCSYAQGVQCFCSDAKLDLNTARLVRRSKEALGVRVSAARIAPSLILGDFLIFLEMSLWLDDFSVGDFDPSMAYPVSFLSVIEIESGLVYASGIGTASHVGGKFVLLNCALARVHVMSHPMAGEEVTPELNAACMREQELSPAGRGTRDPRVNPPVSGIVRHDSHMRKEHVRGRKLKLTNDLGTLGRRAMTPEGQVHQSAVRPWSADQLLWTRPKGHFAVHCAKTRERPAPPSVSGGATHLNTAPLMHHPSFLDLSFHVFGLDVSLTARSLEMVQVAQGEGLGKESAIGFVRDPSQHLHGVLSENHVNRNQDWRAGNRTRVLPNASHHCATSLALDGSHMLFGRHRRERRGGRWHQQLHLVVLSRHCSTVIRRLNKASHISLENLPADGNVFLVSHTKLSPKSSPDRLGGDWLAINPKRPLGDRADDKKTAPEDSRNWTRAEVRSCSPFNCFSFLSRVVAFGNPTFNWTCGTLGIVAAVLRGRGYVQPPDGGLRQTHSRRQILLGRRLTSGPARTDSLWMGSSGGVRRAGHLEWMTQPRYTLDTLSSGELPASCFLPLVACTLSLSCFRQLQRESLTDMILVKYRNKGIDSEIPAIERKVSILVSYQKYRNIPNRRFRSFKKFCLVPLQCRNSRVRLPNEAVFPLLRSAGAIRDALQVRHRLYAQGSELACSVLVLRANRVRFPAGSLPDFCTWELCRAIPLVGGFSRGFPISPFLAFQLRSKLGSLYPLLRRNCLSTSTSPMLVMLFAGIGCSRPSVLSLGRNNQANRDVTTMASRPREAEDGRRKSLGRHGANGRRGARNNLARQRLLARRRKTRPAVKSASGPLLIEARYRRQDCTPVHCFARRGDERIDAHVSVVPIAPTLLGIRRAKFLPGGHLKGAACLDVFSTFEEGKRGTDDDIDTRG